MVKEQQSLQKPYVAAVIAAAGAAQRMQGLDKQFEEIGGVPVLVRTMFALADSDWIDELVLVVRQRDIPLVLDLIRAYAVPKVHSVLAGGETRQQSVQKGVAAVSEKTQYVAIHDGARPLVSQQVIAQTVIDAVQYGAAAAAVPVTDTIKRVDAQKKIVETPDRSNLYAVQTPQVFLLANYKEAAAQVQEEFSDDCQLLEAAGKPVYLSRGAYENLKITTPIDLFIAQALISQMEGR